MGNVNCSPQDCMNMRPAQAASECLQNGQKSNSQARINTGTAQELIDEWSRVVQSVSHNFADDPEGNLFVIRLSKPLLSHLFSKPVKPQKRQQITSAAASDRQQSSYNSSKRGKILSNIITSPQVSNFRREDKTTQEQTLLESISIKELLTLINAHTSYHSQFLPFMVQSEPADPDERQDSQNRSQNNLPQAKARYELQLMHSTAVLVLADTSAVRCYDLQMPEQLHHSSFSLQKVQVSPGTEIDLKARQLLNQMREFFHLHNQMILGSIQLSENEYQIMFVKGCKEEICPRQSYWPRMLEGELIHSLSLLPELLQKDDYKDTHTLQCIIRMQSYNYGGTTHGQKQIQMNRGLTPVGGLIMQVQFLVIFKEIVFLPHKIDTLLQLQRDVTLELSKINQQKVLNMVYNLAPKTYLLITSQRKLRHGNKHHKAHVQKVADKLQAQEKQNRKNRQSNQKDSSNDCQIQTNEATQEDEETKDGLILSSSQIQIHMNQSHTIDQLMFKSYQTNYVASRFNDRHTQGMILDEDLKSFAKVRSENLIDDQQPVTMANHQINEDKKQVQLKPQSLIQLEALLACKNQEDMDSEQVELSHISRYGPLKGDYLVDFSQIQEENKLKESVQRRPIIQVLDSTQKIGKIQTVGYVHYETELLHTEQTVVKESVKNLKQVIQKIPEMQIDGDKLKYLGIEGNWKVYYEEGSLTKFVYLSQRPQFIANCLHEVQLYKSKIQGQLFGHEIAFENENNQLDGFAVRCNRPAIFLDDLVNNLWSEQLADQCLEKHSDLKVFYILFQIAKQVQDLIIAKKLHNSCLCLRSFHFCRLNWEVKLTNFVFTRSQDHVQNRGCISEFVSDQQAMVGLIESLTQLDANSRDTKIALCHLSDLLETNYEQGMLTVQDICRKQLVDNVQSLIQTFTAEEKLEQAFVFLLKSLQLNPNQQNPYSWSTLRTRNKIDDLRKSGPQSQAIVCQRIIYESATTKAEIIEFLNECQNKIMGAFSNAKLSQTDEETKEDKDSIIVMDFEKLQALPTTKETQCIDDMEEMAKLGIILLYYYIEKQLNHTTGNIAEAQETLHALKELYNYDFDNVYYQLIRTMMADVRIQVAREEQQSEHTEAQETNANTHLDSDSSKLDQARIQLLKDNHRSDLAAKIFEDLYLGQHPLADLYGADGTVDLEKLNSTQLERLIPFYFRQRLALTQRQLGQQYLDAEQISSTVLISKLTGVGSSVAKMQDYDSVYLKFYNMQRLVLIYLYHGIVLPQESFTCADLSDYAASYSQNNQQQTTQSAQKENSRGSSLVGQRGGGNMRKNLNNGTSSNSSSSRKVRPQPFYLQLQKFIRRLFYKSQEAQQAVQQIFAEFTEALLFLQLDSNRESHDQIMQVFCPDNTPSQLHSQQKTGLGIQQERQEEKLSESSKEISVQLSTFTQTKFQRLELCLQQMKERIASFDQQLILDQHDKFFRQEYYKAAYGNQTVPRYDSETDTMEPEDLCDQFACYLAIVLQINEDRSLSETELEAFEAQKTNFLRCPCCPASLF